MPNRPSPGGMTGRAPAQQQQKPAPPKTYNELDFKNEKPDKMMTKATFGALAFIILLGAAIFMFDLGWHLALLDVLLFASWSAYFVISIVKRRDFVELSDKEKVRYWTYENTEEFAKRTETLNMFREKLKEFADSDTPINAISSTMVSYDPLIFEVRVATSKGGDKKVPPRLSEWGSQFECEAGITTKLTTNTYRVIYPRSSVWETLAGKTVSNKDAIGDVITEPTVDRNPIGIRTDSLEEMYLNNAIYHTCVFGQTGSGKSCLFNVILCNLFPTNAIILFFDKKGGVEANTVRDRCFCVDDDIKAIAWLRAIDKEMKRRNKYITDHGKKKFLSETAAKGDRDAMPFTDDMPPVIVAMDECREWNTGIESTYKIEFKRLVSSISTLGRNTGITLLSASQGASDKHIAEEVKANSVQKIAFKLEADQEVNANVPKEKEGELRPAMIPAAPPDNPAGGGVGQFILKSGLTNEKCVPVKSYYMSSDQLREEARIYSRNKKVSHPLVLQALEEYETLNGDSDAAGFLS